jgi:hypothetical protein
VEKVHAPKWQDKKEKLQELYVLATDCLKIEITQNTHDCVAQLKVSHPFIH